jgi:hypothetical protein
MNKPLLDLMWGVQLFLEKHTQWYLHAGMIYSDISLSGYIN